MQSDHKEKLPNENKDVQKWKREDPRQKHSEKCLVKLVALDLLPLSFVESNNLKDFVDSLEPAFNIPSRKYFVNALMLEEHRLTMSKVQELVDLADHIYLTLDIWCNRQMRGFIGITGHFSIDFNLKTVLFCCKRVKCRHTGENIHQIYDQVAMLFKMSKKISGIVTDNGSNVVAAFSLPGFERSFLKMLRSTTEDDVDDDGADEDDE